MTSAITREMVAVILPLALKISNMTGCAKCSCNRNVERNCKEIEDEPNNTPPVIGFSFAICHPHLSQKADCFQFLVDLGSSKYFIDPELVRRGKSRILEYTRIEPLTDITAAGNNVLRGAA